MLPLTYFPLCLLELHSRLHAHPTYPDILLLSSTLLLIEPLKAPHSSPKLKLFSHLPDDHG